MPNANSAASRYGVRPDTIHNLYGGGVGGEAISFFTSHGYSKAAAAGIVGNMKQESSLNPNAPGGGLIQGQGGRTSSGTARQQFEGVLHELQGPERGTAAALKAAKTPEEAARIFSQRFERPGIPMLGNREKYAREAFGQGGPGPTPQAEAKPATAIPGTPATSTTALDPEAFKAAQAKVATNQFVAKELGGGTNNILPGTMNLSAPNPAEFTKTTTTPGVPAEKAPALPGASSPGPGSYGALAGSGLTFAGPDQGIDFTGKGAVRAPADLKITRVGANTGWSGEGNMVVGQILSGPSKGRFVYFAEDLHPNVKEGQVVREGEAVAQATGSGKAPGIEVGFSQDAHGTAYGTTHDGKPGGPSPVHGQEFAKFIQSKQGSAPAALPGASTNAKGGNGFSPASGTNYSQGKLSDLSAKLNAMGRAQGVKLTGISGYRTPQHSVAVGGFANDPHTKGLASDTEGTQNIPKSVLNKYGLERPFPGAKEADHIQVLHSVNANGGY